MGGEPDISPGASARVPAPSPLTERRLLIVEDSPTMRRVIRRFLDSTGYVIFEAGDGEEALRLAARERPDVILLDVQIPLLDGFGVLASLQTDAALSEIPVVLVTARSEAEDVADGLHRGAHDYLRKPFEQPELLARVHAAMRTKALRDELRARNAQLELMVNTDLVTGLLNRRATDEQLASLISRSRRHAAALSLLLVDVDGLRAVNGTHGSAVGDAVLETVAARVSEQLREEDVLGRWGGDELIVLAPDTGPEGAARLATRVRGAIAATPVATEAGALVTTVTVGVSTLAADDGAGDLVRRAEESLRAAAGDA
jgi:two-component system, cell cycle response regulator